MGRSQQWSHCKNRFSRTVCGERLYRPRKFQISVKAGPGETSEFSHGERSHRAVVVSAQHLHRVPIRREVHCQPEKKAFNAPTPRVE